MISLTYDITTGLVKVAAPALIKLGADVPVRLTFSADPGDVSSLQLALGTDAADPDTLAFTETFTSEDETDTIWTAVLDASDSRLSDFMSGKGPTLVNLEIVAVLDGERNVAPNVGVTVQPAIISGAPTSEGGPTYLTDAQTAAAYVPFTIKTTTGNPATPSVPMLVINTFDNTVKLYADGGWRTLVTW